MIKLPVLLELVNTTVETSETIVIPAGASK